MAAAKTLKFLNLIDAYERRARFFPAVLTVAVLLPLAVMVGAPLAHWLVLLPAGVGFAGALAIGLSHLASAAGNRLQAKLFPRWPHDSPTNLWLNPQDTTCSEQQKDRWYIAIKRITKLDIRAAADNHDEVERVINDAVRALRAIFWRSEHAERLTMHNAEYGFVRNLAGLRPVWLPEAVVSSVLCWVLFYHSGGELAWPVVATVFLAICMAAAMVLPAYVLQAARHYADSFFGALKKCDEAALANAKSARNPRTRSPDPGQEAASESTPNDCEGKPSEP